MERLLTSPALGGFFLFLIFAGCFLLVHICLLVKIGWNYKTGGNPPAPPEKKAEEKPVSKPPDPVYYIVEKKRKKPKTSYSEPKEFHFK